MLTLYNIRPVACQNTCFDLYLHTIPGLSLFDQFWVKINSFEKERKSEKEELNFSFTSKINVLFDEIVLSIRCHLNHFNAMEASSKCMFDVGFYLKQDIIYLTSFVDTFLPHTSIGRFNLDNAWLKFALSIYCRKCSIWRFMFVLIIKNMKERKLIFKYSDTGWDIKAVRLLFTKAWTKIELVNQLSSKYGSALLNRTSSITFDENL